MPEERVEIKNIEKIDTKTKVVEEKQPEGEPERRIMTTVTLQFEGTSAALDPVLRAIAAGHRVSAELFTPQWSLPLV